MITRPRQFARVLNFSCIVEYDANSNEAVIERNAVPAEACNEEIRRLANEPDVSQQVRTSSQVHEERSSIVR